MTHDHRHIEPVIERIAKRNPIIVLTGARQVGKSTMLKEVYHNINYVTLNRPPVRESAKENVKLVGIGRQRHLSLEHIY